jgi:type 1 glutamine amidotransferase
MRGLTTLAVVAALAAPLVTGVSTRAAKPPVRPPTDQEIQKMKDAVPAQPAAKPAKPRKVLVWGHMDAHPPNPFAAKLIEIMAAKTGAFEATVSEDPATLLPESLEGYDAIVMNNIHRREPFLPPDIGKRPKDEQNAARQRVEAIKKSIMDFVRRGRGIAGIHAATAAFQTWAEYGEMIGGYYAGHIFQEVPIKLDEPGHPLLAMFPGKGFTINDEIYFHRAPHDPAKLRILMSLDIEKMKDPGKRPDKIYAISWVRPWGSGRIFYCTLGHASETYWNPPVVRHYLAGIQFAIGDLKAEADPR